MRKFILFLAVYFACASAFANTYTVINCADSGAGSLRQAILDANSNVGYDTIEFNIPITEPYTATGGFTTEAGVSWWRIIPTTVANAGAYVLPALLDPGTYIHGSTQKANQTINNPTGPTGPWIEIDGIVGTLESGIYLLRNFCTVEGLVVNRYGAAGVTIYGVNSCEVKGCYLGVDPNGAGGHKNNRGVSIANGGKYNKIGGTSASDRNILSGNNSDGVLIISSGSDSNEVIGNYIGTDPTGTSAVANGAYGIDIYDIAGAGGQYNIIGGSTAGARNIISGNSNCGIFSAHGPNYILGNYIGTDVNGTSSLANTYYGIRVGAAASISDSNIIGPNNIIAFNQESGITVEAGTFNKITQNSIFSNTKYAIFLCSGQNSNEARPLISSSTYQLPDGPLTVSGTAPAGSSVEVFVTENVPLAVGGGGKTYLGVTTAGGDTNWSFSVNQTATTVCATATDPYGNTSAFSLNVTTQDLAPTTTTTTSTTTTTTTGGTTTTTVPTTSTTEASTTTSTTTTTTTMAPSSLQTSLSYENGILMTKVYLESNQTAKIQIFEAGGRQLYEGPVVESGLNSLNLQNFVGGRLVRGKTYTVIVIKSGQTPFMQNFVYNP